jgi:sporulation protein YlmC with PRC-barrel domain
VDHAVVASDRLDEIVLRPGADVYSTDRVAAKLTDIVVDPIARAITHLVVTPPGEHQQARLVPLWLVNSSKDGIRVELDARHLKQLQRVLRTDFLRLPKADIEGEMTVRFRTVLIHPYFEDPWSAEELENSTGILRDDCPIHLGNDVVSNNDRFLGQIVALLVRDDRIHRMVVRSGLVGFHNNVIVPIDSIAEVMADMVILDIDRHQFRQLPSSSIVTVAKPTRDLKQQLEHLAASSWFAVRDFLVDLRS